MVNVYQISSFDDYLAVMEKYKGNYLFRGQSNIEWKITPSIFRDEKSLKNEANLILGYECFDPDNIGTSIFKMQHYGKMSRMIDLTNSIYSSLFFACDGHTDTDGVVYIFDKQTIEFSKKKDVEDFCKILVEKTMDDMTFSDEKLQKYAKDMFINYSYDFSYSNDRAILQGGTAILVGLGIIGNKLNRNKNLNIEDYACKKIIIPSEFKATILANLKKIGYTSEFLYGNFDFNNKDNQIILECSKLKITIFKKINASYKINKLTYNIDKLVELIENEYTNYFSKYGANSRIWIYIYYDEIDLNAGNYICRATWAEKSPCNIVWNKEHMLKRLCSLNENINSEVVLKNGMSIFKRACGIESKFRKYYQDFPLNELIIKIKPFQIEVRNLLFEASETKHCEGEIDSYFDSVNIYVSCVDQLINDFINFQERGDNIMSLNYFIENQLEKCRLQNEKVILPRIIKRGSVKKI